MNIRLSVYFFYFISVTSSYIYCMEDPLVIDPSLFDEDKKAEQGITQVVVKVVDRLLGVDVYKESTKIDFNYSVKSAADLEYGLGMLGEFLKDSSVDGRMVSHTLIHNLIKGIEKLYVQDPQKIVDIVDRNYDKLTPVARKVFDSCLDECRKKVMRDDAYWSRFRFVVGAAIFAFVAHGMIQETYL